MCGQRNTKHVAYVDKELDKNGNVCAKYLILVRFFIVRTKRKERGSTQSNRKSRRV